MCEKREEKQKLSPKNRISDLIYLLRMRIPQSAKKKKENNTLKNVSHDSSANDAHVLLLEFYIRIYCALGEEYLNKR